MMYRYIGNHCWNSSSTSVRWNSKFSTSPHSLRSNTKYCIDIIRKHDYENYLSLLFLPAKARSAAIAIRAYNVEIALVDQSVTDSNIGAMRLQFWRDALDKMYQNSPPKHPVAEELCEVVNKFQLQKIWLQRIIDSRAAFMNKTRPFTTIEDIEEYAENTVSSLYYLTLQAAGVREVSCDHAASHLGKSYGLCAHLRSLLHHAVPPSDRSERHRRRALVPAELLAKYQLSEQAVLRAGDSATAHLGKESTPMRGMRDDTNSAEKLRSCTYDTAAVAYLHLSAAKSLKDKIPPEVKNVFLPCVICEWYLERLRHCDFYVFNPRLQQRNLWLPWTLWRRSKKSSVL